jgi:hypothetical protein
MDELRRQAEKAKNSDGEIARLKEKVKEANLDVHRTLVLKGERDSARAELEKVKADNEGLKEQLDTAHLLYDKASKKTAEVKASGQAAERQVSEQLQRLLKDLDSARTSLDLSEGQCMRERELRANEHTQLADTRRRLDAATAELRLARAQTEVQETSLEEYNSLLEETDRLRDQVVEARKDAAGHIAAFKRAEKQIEQVVRDAEKSEAASAAALKDMQAELQRAKAERKNPPAQHQTAPATARALPFSPGPSKFAPMLRPGVSPVRATPARAGQLTMTPSRAAQVLTPTSPGTLGRAAAAEAQATFGIPLPPVDPGASEKQKERREEIARLVGRRFAPDALPNLRSTATSAAARGPVSPLVFWQLVLLDTAMTLLRRDSAAPGAYVMIHVAVEALVRDVLGVPQMRAAEAAALRDLVLADTAVALPAINLREEINPSDLNPMGVGFAVDGKGNNSTIGNKKYPTSEKAMMEAGGGKPSLLSLAVAAQDHAGRVALLDSDGDWRIFEILQVKKDQVRLRAMVIDDDGDVAREPAAWRSETDLAEHFQAAKSWSLGDAFPTESPLQGMEDPHPAETRLETMAQEAKPKHMVTTTTVNDIMANLGKQFPDSNTASAGIICC